MRRIERTLYIQVTHVLYFTLFDNSTKKKQNTVLPSTQNDESLPHSQSLIYITHNKFFQIKADEIDYAMAQPIE